MIDYLASGEESETMAALYSKQRELLPSGFPDHEFLVGVNEERQVGILTGRRMDLVADRTRTVNRLRAQLTGTFPGLERALDLTNTGPLMLLTGYQTPAALRRTGKKRLETWLRNRSVLRADRLAETALEAAGRQHTSLPGEKLTAQMVYTLAAEVMALNQQVAEIDKATEARFREHHDFEVIAGMPGLGVILGAEFLAATGGDMTAFGTADRLAGFGGVAPVPRDSGKISGNLRRPRRYNRRLQRVLFSICHCEDSRRFYERKRAEGKRRIQAVLALARRRVNVLWALLRDRRPYELAPPKALAA
ncbi:transposase [Streptomyces sp. NPDC005096]|uniref:transposase n=1 Tax=Streptomyces sp. NPDC005096 TaxID=3154559 RepID=UPI0033B5304F